MNWLKRLLGGERKTEPVSPIERARQIIESKPPAPLPDEASVAQALRMKLSFDVMSVPGTDALAAWRRYQQQWRAEGGSAVLLGDDEEANRIAELVESSETPPEATLRTADALKAGEFFARKRSDAVAEEGGGEPPLGEWPAGSPPMSLTAHLETLGRKPKHRVWIARIPTTKSWEIPAYLRFGGWNDCPMPEEQVAVLKHWAETYGIEIYAITGDVMECEVSRPPTSKDAAIALAHEQYWYCSDIVLQGTETLSILAAGLLNSPAWFFWWD